ncbi:MAG: PAS domain-containing protein [Gammaproteobacteria bacterium]|nr:PAS domain-containing protein [Gammaproteobacteria bacterium]
MDQQISVSHVVGIGASAGGLEALESFFARVPSDTGMAFVVIQHLTPDFKSVMDELLARHTEMAIRVIDEGMPLEPNTVYLIPSRKMITIDAKVFHVTERDQRLALHLPIDLFLVSLAETWHNHAIAIILSGTGSDGTRGVRAIHEQGGLVVCQTPETAHFDGMPRSAIGSGVVDITSAPAAMPNVLLDYIRHEHHISDTLAGAEVQGESDDPFMPIYNILGTRFGVEFNHYKPGTISRRIERRMALHGVPSVHDYVELLKALPNEPLNLYRDLLIGVTEFFRDRAAWEVLEETIIPKVCADASAEREIRCWVPGTATGEEAYSLAIAIHEYLTHHDLPVNVRIFATDVHLDSLETAGAGIYNGSALTTISPKRASRYFKRIEDDRFQIMPEIRSLVVFAKQNLTRDPPFTRLDLITCRNTLIYFDQETQNRVLCTFHFALNLGGHLFLGSSESLGVLSEEFEVAERQWKIFSKRRDIRLPPAIRTDESTSAYEKDALLRWSNRAHPRNLVGRDVTMLRSYDILLERYVPPAVLLDENGRLVHTFNKASEYLRPRPGAASLSIMDLVHPDLRMAVSTGLQRATREPAGVRYGGIRVRMSDDDVRIVRVTAELLGRHTPSDHFLIVFEEAQALESVPALLDAATGAEVATDELPTLDPDSAQSEHVARLEQELRYTKEYLQATIEELETSNEELQATNEELMSANEELQSTNEELHSVNEELYTVNKEYEMKINELTVLNDDMDNLLASTEIGTVFLDEALCVRRFTPAVGRQFSLLAQDIGRPIAHLNRKVNFPEFLSKLGAVLNSGEESEFEVCDTDGNWFLMRMHPYRHETGRIGGVVVTFVDISRIKEASEQLEQRNENLQGFAYAVSHDLSEPLRMVSGFARLLADKYDDALDDKARRYISQIETGAGRLHTMLQGILEYSRVVTRAEVREVVDFYDLVEDARTALSTLIAKTGARIDTRILPNRILVDRRQIVRVIRELIENAIKFSGDAKPEVKFDSKLDNEDWLISVADNGIGIQMADRERVFHMFWRSEKSSELPGTGVGLAVARRIAERHGGSLTCEAGPDGRGCFELRLPAAIEESSAEAPTAD